MKFKDLSAEIADLELRIAALPQGSITKKTVNGKLYYYQRWTEFHKRHEKYIPADQVEVMREQIKLRKQLEKELKPLREKCSLVAEPQVRYDVTPSRIRRGKDLLPFADSVRCYRRREGYQQMHDYIWGDVRHRVFILYGLRRTGKTTLMYQIMAEMSEQELEQTAFVQVTSQDSLDMVCSSIDALEHQGIRYLFLDEITRLDGFIPCASIFSDIYASAGIKVVLSGTDSLSFFFAEYEQLYDRCLILHTTFIPYREYEGVLGLTGIDEYIRYGGTMSLGGVHYNNSTFTGKENVDEYVNQAIALNMQHSLSLYQQVRLCRYQHGRYFRHLLDLCEKGELTSAVNRVVEELNHRFTLDVLTRKYKPHDLVVSAPNLNNDDSHRTDNPDRTDILARTDITTVTERLRHHLTILNREEQTVDIDEVCAAQIKEYLDRLELTWDFKVDYLPSDRRPQIRTVISQPGLRYAQAEALISSLNMNQTFGELSADERLEVQERILTEIKGRMLEDIVLLETHIAYPEKKVFVAQFRKGEFDMVVQEANSFRCAIYEVKYSTKIAESQGRHLLDAGNCALTEKSFGKITSKTVLYRGESQEVDGLHYQNVEEYLRNLPAQVLLPRSFRYIRST